jgi:Protein kinase domain
MSLPHPGPETLELYVLEARDQISVDEVEAHLSSCESCTAEVRRLMQVEMALGEMAAEAVFCPGCSAVLVTARCQLCGAAAEVGGFRVEKVIVQNAHGRMYLARDRAGQPVALKELAFVQPPHPDAVEAFEREARLLRHLCHPQIPRFLASSRHGEGVNTRLYLAQEYVAGESLLVRLGQHQFSEDEAVEVALQVLSILEYLQALAPMVFHRDIKPANLIRRPDGQIALVDFGAARDLGSTVGATLVGTFGYMPVEQMGGIVDATTDLHALGATLSHLLSRQEPWSFLADPEALGRLNASRGFRLWLGKLLARRPSDRYPSASAAAVALRGTVRGRRGRAVTRLPVGIVGTLCAGLAVGALASLFSDGWTITRRVSGRTDLYLDTVPAFVVHGPRVLGPAPAERMSRPARVDDEGPPGTPLWVETPRLAIDPQDVRFHIRLPPAVVGSTGIWFQAELCASREGKVTSVTVTRNPHPELESEIVATLMRWRYEPVLRAGVAVPFCTQLRYEVAPR